MERLFWKVTSFPKTIVASWLLIVMLLGAFLPRLTKDTRTESFIPPHHPAVVYRNKVKAIFGLSDPVIIAVFNDGPNGVFTPASLQLVQWLTERIQMVDGVDPERVTSLATESNIVGTADGMVVAPFFREIPATQKEADRLRAAVMDFPLYVGSLVARDGRATLIVAELLDASDGGKVYTEFLALAEQAPTRGEQLHIAGDGAATAYLETYIDADVRWVNPLVALIITGVLLIAYRTLRGALLSNLVVVSAAIVAVGGMAATGVPFYLITSALPVILVAIGVADGIHILGQYYEGMAHRPRAPHQEIVVRAMTDIWRPVMVTSLTDIAGFLAIAIASFMPPMQAFGLFAALGVFAAMLFSLMVLPAILVLLASQIEPCLPALNAFIYRHGHPHGCRRGSARHGRCGTLGQGLSACGANRSRGVGRGWRGWHLAIGSEWVTH